ncbi:Hypothetical_protein [Hexamita inflata]|uniref:Hypothetical_protein n=1 Tax=Hexamita inflata TaxID=28002 RepID=A0ABP1IKL5_9EUKA
MILQRFPCSSLRTFLLKKQASAVIVPTIFLCGPVPYLFLYFTIPLRRVMNLIPINTSNSSISEIISYLNLIIVDNDGALNSRISLSYAFLESNNFVIHYNFSFLVCCFQRAVSSKCNCFNITISNNSPSVYSLPFSGQSYSIIVLCNSERAVSSFLYLAIYPLRLLTVKFSSAIVSFSRFICKLQQPRSDLSICVSYLLVGEWFIKNVNQKMYKMKEISIVLFFLGHFRND